jgi:hypothetical protein
MTTTRRKILIGATLTMAVNLLAAPLIAGQSPSPEGSDEPACVAPPASSTMVEPGCTFTTTRFKPQFAITPSVPGWTPLLDAEDQVYLQAYLPGAGEANEAWSLVAVDDLTAEPCVEDPDSPLWSGPYPSFSPEPGEAVASFIDWLESVYPLPLPAATRSEVAGIPATRLDLDPPPRAFAACNNFIIVTDSDSPGGPFGIPDFGRNRWDIIELGGRLLIISAFEGTLERWDDFIVQADELASTITFTLAGEPSPSP